MTAQEARELTQKRRKESYGGVFSKIEEAADRGLSHINFPATHIDKNGIPYLEGLGYHVVQEVDVLKIFW